MTAGSECITVNKALSIPISSFKSAYVSNDDSCSIAMWLGRNHVESVYSRQKSADLEVQCESDIGWALPEMGPCGNISTKDYRKIIIRFIDTASNKVIGEVKYKRPGIKWGMRGVLDQMLDTLTSQQYGLTDFTKLEKRSFPKARLRLELPGSFRNVDETPYSDTLLSLYMHPMASKDGPAQSQLFIQFKIFDIAKAEAEKQTILKGANAQNAPEYRKRYEWELSYQPNFTNMAEFAVNGPWMIYLRDLKTKEGRIIRARADLNTQLRPEGYAVDERAIKRIFESLEAY